MSLAIVISTYNEKENISDLTTEILQLNIDVEIIVVDDDSPDGTYKIAQELALINPHIHLIHRKENRGRGLAGIVGFKYAINLENIDYIVEMDADFSHQPKYILDFLKIIPEYDVVIGSRFINSGRDSERNILRRIVSKFARMYIQAITGIKIADPTSGFRCFKKSALQGIDLDTLTSQGPTIIIELLYYCHLKKYKIKEIPITFAERKKGVSKLGLNTLLYSLLFPWEMRFRKK